MSEERFLLFRAGGSPYALSLQEVSEVMEPQPSFPIPAAPSHFVGLINVHGALTALVDLAGYLGAPTRVGPGKVLVLDTRRSALALGVDGVSAIVTRPPVPEGEEPQPEDELATPQGTFRRLKLDALLAGLEQGL